MKKLFLLIYVTMTLIQGFAQVAINTNNALPNPSAMLDIRSDNKGLLIPRLSTLARTSIVSPAKGLIVYDTTLSTFFFHNGSAWTQLSTGAATNYWNSAGINIYNNNTGNIGIGTTDPAHARLEINGTVGAVAAMFGADKCGIAIEADSPEIGFNYYYNGGTRTIKTGYGFNMGMDPGTGELYFGNFNGNQSTGNFGAITGYQKIATFNQKGKLGLGMIPTSGTLDKRLQITGGLNLADDEITLSNGGTTGGKIKGVGGKLYIDASKNLDPALSGNVYLQSTSYVGFPISYAGNVVIGDGTTALAKLHVEGAVDHNVALFKNIGTNSTGISIQADWPGVFSNCYWSNGPKTMAGAGYSTAISFNQDNGSIQFLANPNPNTAPGASVDLYKVMQIGSDGRVAIGTIYPATGYKLSVAGKAICEELTVKMTTSWPDYVFSKDYQLKSLPDLENYIRINNHLPNVPAASAIEKEGVQLGDMQKKMMEKIEELTLYMIAQDKKIRDLETKLEATRK